MPQPQSRWRRPGQGSNVTLVLRSSRGGRALREPRCGEPRQVIQQRVLEAPVMYGGVGVAELLVVPVAAAGPGPQVVAGSQPFLSQVTEAQVIGGGGAAHPGGHPAGIN